LEIFDLGVSERKGTGKGQARALRRNGFIPAVLYGPKTETVSLSVSAADLTAIYKRSESEHVILNLMIQNGGTRNKTAMIKEMQVSPLSHEYLHVDFYEISMDQEIVVKVPVELTGSSVGVERGGFLQLIRHQLEVACLPGDIPNKIQVDISGLDIGDSIHVEQVQAKDKVRLVYDSNFTVVTVVAPSLAKEEVAEEVPEEGVEEGEAAGEAKASEPVADE
jgi:large subunit ribosomal protein L25